jgi:carbonic anhydrase
MAAGNWDYSYNGADWDKIEPACKGPAQSPIDLSRKQDNPKFTWVDFKEDGFFNLYKNQVKDIKVQWKDNHTT